MANKEYKRFTISVDEKTYKELVQISKNTKDSLAETTRKYIKKGLAKDYIDDSKDLIASLVREELKAALKPSVERLAALSSKAGHMAATAAFLNVQALMDLVPKENRKDVREMYESARKKAVEYMKNRLGE